MDSSPDATASVMIDGMKFPLANSVEALCKVIALEERGALRFPIAAIREVFTTLIQEVQKCYGRESRQAREVVNASLICTGCLWKFPDSYKLRLLIPYKKALGGMPGFDQFDKSGICPHCGNDEALLVYECPVPEEVSEADVHAIRRYWQEQALTWWSQQQRSQAICDFCNANVARNQGYLYSTHLLCEDCVEKTLANALAELKRNPDYYDKGLLRKARSLR